MPKQTQEQRREALLRANAVRTTRARAKEVWHTMDVAQARARLVDVLMAPPFWAERWRVEAALMALPRLGPVKARWVMREVGIHPSRTISGLTARQRDGLIEWLNEKAAPEGGPR